MDLMKAFAIALRNDKDFNGVWPEPATSFTQDSTYGGEFDEEVPCTTWRGDPTTATEFEFDGPYLEEYEEGETITKEEYNAFVAANPSWYEDMLAARPAIVERIAALNKEIASRVDEISALADEAGIDTFISLGQYGGLDPNSDWDSSRC